MMSLWMYKIFYAVHLISFVPLEIHTLFMLSLTRNCAKQFKRNSLLFNKLLIITPVLK